jgi:hypothetical protein
LYRTAKTIIAIREERNAIMKIKLYSESVTHSGFLNVSAFNTKETDCATKTMRAIMLITILILTNKHLLDSKKFGDSMIHGAYR